MGTFRLNIRKPAAVVVIFLASCAGRAETPQLTAEQARVLESTRSIALQYRHRLPDFICTQITHRNVASKSMGVLSAGMATRNPGAIPSSNENSSDVVEERLTYVGEKENYEVLTVDGRSAKGKSHAEIEGGAISGGEFGSVLAQIFEPSSHTAFTWYRRTTLRKRRVDVFGFRVPKEAGTTVTDARSNNRTIVSFSGQVYIDPETLQVLEISTKHDMPPGFSIQLIERRIAYGPEEIGGKVFSLPLFSEIHMEDGSRVYVNKIEFKNYHRFTSESTIQTVEAQPN